MRLAALGAPLALGLAGCYLTASYSDLIDGPHDRASGDAGAAREASSPAPFCAPGGAGPSVYCMDFDGVDPAVLDLQTGNADASLVTGTELMPPSPPSALLVSTTAAGAFGTFTVGLGDPASPSRKLELELEMRVLAVADGLTAVNIGVVGAASQTFYVLSVGVTSDGLFQVQELERPTSGAQSVTGHPDDLTNVPRATDGHWHHLVLVLALAGSGGGTSSLAIDDGGVVEQNRPLALSWEPGSTSITIGTTYSAGGGDQVAYDNVRATWSTP